MNKSLKYNANFKKACLPKKSKSQRNNSTICKMDKTKWKESYDQLSILKSRDITLPTKVRLVKAMVFPVVMYGCESLTMKKAEH